MKYYKRLIKIAEISVIVLFLSVTTGVGEEKSNTDNMTEESPQIVINGSLETALEEEEAVKIDKAEESLFQDAAIAVDETRKAVEALNKDNTEEALADLERVVGKLEILLARKPELSMIPFDARVETIRLATDVKRVKALRKEAELLLKKGYLQDARYLLDTLASEIRVTTSHIPIQTYPLAIKVAARLIEKGKPQEAKLTLIRALNTFILTEQRIAIPLLEAQKLVHVVSELTKTKKPHEFSKDEKEEILGLLSRARTQLELAEELGYGRKDREFVDLHKKVEEIEVKIRTNSETVDLFTKLNAQIQAFKERISQHQEENTEEETIAVEQTTQ